ncbi:MAG TPA: hypothetical protein DD465_09865 [Thalassospira sp.]|nr:hypothetical protein [Thalassospira sp.]|tara:strand:- start:642 stop:836 length:195 start_codon:yes stop_codon:yes gene_type:complete
MPFIIRTDIKKTCAARATQVFADCSDQTTSRYGLEPITSMKLDNGQPIESSQLATQKYPVAHTT